MKGILGRKAGMTQVFAKNGLLIPVTVIETKDNIVTQVKNTETDGYISTQLSIGEQKSQRVPKAKSGHYKKAKTTPKRYTKEIRNMSGFNLGDKLKASDLFKIGELVDVSGTSKGKGFAGVIKRHNAQRGPMSHGSQFHRQIGSMSDVEGNKIQKGKKMPGQMGSVKRTTQNLEIIDINDAQGYILVKGSTPGPNASWLVVKSSVKKVSAKTPIELIDYVKDTKLDLEAKTQASQEAEDLAKDNDNLPEKESVSKQEEKTEVKTPKDLKSKDSKPEVKAQDNVKNQTKVKEQTPPEETKEENTKE